MSNAIPQSPYQPAPLHTLRPVRLVDMAHEAKSVKEANEILDAHFKATGNKVANEGLKAELIAKGIL